MKNKKSFLLLSLIFILVTAALYLTYIIQDGSDPLTTLNLRAEEPTSLDEELDSLLQQAEGTPTPTVAYKSTSPSPSPTRVPGGATSPSITATPSASVTVTAGITATLSPSPSPTAYTEYITATPIPMVSTIASQPTPTPITTLPVAGFADELPKYLLGGGLLVLVALFL